MASRYHQLGRAMLRVISVVVVVAVVVDMNLVTDTAHPEAGNIEKLAVGNDTGC